jgi:hypothetical protein
MPMTVPRDWIPLPRVPAELGRAYGPAAVAEAGASYYALWRLVVDGIIPAERVGGRWYVDRPDLPRVAEALGLPAATA